MMMINHFDLMNYQNYFDENRFFVQDLLIDHVEILLNLTKIFHSIAMYDHPIKKNNDFSFLEKNLPINNDQYHQDFLIVYQ